MKIFLLTLLFQFNRNNDLGIRIISDNVELCRLSSIVWSSLIKEDPILQFFERVKERDNKMKRPHTRCSSCTYDKAQQAEYENYMIVLIESTCQSHNYPKYSAKTVLEIFEKERKKINEKLDLRDRTIQCKIINLWRSSR